MLAKSDMLSTFEVKRHKNEKKTPNPNEKQILLKDD